MMDNINLKITEDELDESYCRSFVELPECGGIVIFIGTVRNHTREKKVQWLEFESKESMAIKEMTKIAVEAMSKWSIKRIAIHHRLGRLEKGEVPVIIAVSSPHRDVAFEACKYAIDTLKETVPIWKKEVFEDGEIWVAAHP